MTRPILWTSTSSSGSLSHMAVAEAGADYDVRFLSMRARAEHKTPEYLAINSKGEVPALQLAPGRVITETPAILFHVADTHPASNLLPTDPYLRAKTLEWVAWCHFTMARSFSFIFQPAKFMPGVPEEAVREPARARVLAALALADSALASGGMIVPETPRTIADLFVFFLAVGAGFMQLDTSHLPHLMRHQATIAALPGVQAALAREAAQG